MAKLSSINKNNKRINLSNRFFVLSVKDAEFITTSNLFIISLKFSYK